jgi:hypothetical protein
MTVLQTTSRRERRLWIGALLVLVAIWSSLFFAGALVPILREQALLGAAFGIGFVLAIVAVAWGALRIGETGREVWIGLAMAVAAWMVLVRTGVPGADRTHLFEYGLLGVLMHEALRERRRNGAAGPPPAFAAVLLTSTAGVLDELVQGVIPGRVLDPRDLVVNALAAVIAVSASSAMRAIRRGMKRG